MTLKESCDSALAAPELTPCLGSDGKLRTFCNLAVARICAEMGYSGFAGLTANEITRKCRREWLSVSGRDAFRLAAKDALCVAALELPRHGHAAVVYPAQAMADSPSWRKAVPLLANVGRVNGIMRASQCFPSEPEYFVRIGGKT